MTEGMELEQDGLTVDLIQGRAPWSLTDGKFVLRDMCKDPGTKQFKDTVPRAVLARDIKIWPTLYVAVDGATHFALTNVRPMNAFPDAYSNEAKNQCSEVLQIVPIFKGETLEDVAELVAQVGEFFAQFAEVVHLAVEGDVEAAVRRGHRLMAGGT